MTSTLLDLAIACGRKRLSTQTEFLHHCYNASDEEAHLPIPVLENLLFALALMRTKNMENMTEGRSIVERLLPFQLENGNFPIYLHEFPEGKDRFLTAHLMIPLLWMKKHFGVVLGSELKAKVDLSLNKMMDYTLHMYNEVTPPTHIGIKIAVAAHALGRSEGEQLLKKYETDTSSFSIPSYLGEWLTALLLVYPSISKSPYQLLWQHINASWHLPTLSYNGPSQKEKQQGFEPEVTVYDLFMSLLSGSFPTRAENDTIVHLQGAMLVNGEEPSAETQKENFSIAVLPLEKKPLITTYIHPLKIVWGDRKRQHSFVMQGGNCVRIDPSVKGNQVELLLDLGAMPNVEDREESREVAFFFDIDDPAEITFDGKASNTFQVGQQVRIRYGGKQIELLVEVVEGEGHFFGHLMRGNRPSQVANKGSKRFNAYDWIVFLRTLRRSEKCRLKAIITVVE